MTETEHKAKRWITPKGLAKGQWPTDPVPVYGWRQQQLAKIRRDPVLLKGAKEYYRTRPVEFINHWIDTYDPRNAGTELPARLPLQLFPRQVELVEFFLACLKAETGGLVEKCRDMGATWVAVGFSVWLWLFWQGAAIGWGSRKEILVDKIGDPDSIFQKMRMVIRGLPREFWPDGFDPDKDMSFMKIVNDESGATITGEGGDNIGRGGRKLIYFKDESAHYERPELIEAALGDNTRVPIDISSVNGQGNVFHRRREAGVEWKPGNPAMPGVTNIFVMDWRDHPAKDQAWYDRRRQQAANEGLLHKFAQEVDRDYAASVEGIVIPAEWVKAAIDAHKKLNIEITGPNIGALDVADEGLDKNATIWRRGILLNAADVWSDRDTGVTTRKAIAAAPKGGGALQYDCIGVGAGVKAEANRLADEELMPVGLKLVPWNAGAAVLDPDGHVEPKDEESPLWKDHCLNLKAQAWWLARRRFEKTWRAINDPDFTWTADELVSIDSHIPNLHTLVKELSQATMGQSANMKLKINKTPEGTRSPNLADAAVMCLCPIPPKSKYTLANI